MIPGTGKQTLTAQEMQRNEIMRITRQLLRLEGERRKIRKRLKEIASDMRILRRAQRIVLAPSFQPEDIVSAPTRTEGDK